MIQPPRHNLEICSGRLEGFVQPSRPALFVAGAAVALLLVGPAAAQLPIHIGPEACPEGEICDPAAPKLPDLAAPAPVASVKPPQPSFLDQVGAFLSGTAARIGHAISEGAKATAGFAIAGLTLLLGGLAAALASLRPANVPVIAWAAASAGTTAALAGAAQTGAWFAWKKLLPLLSAIPGFSRIAKDELLENERRSRIFEMIRQNPGIRVAELSRGLELPWGSAIHHLRKLRADRLIMFQTVGAHKCYFINGSGLTQEGMTTASTVQGQTVEGIAAYLGAHPRASLKEVAQGVGISSPLAAFHVAKLEKAGLVSKVRDGRSVRLVPAAGLCPTSAPPLA